ncbi:MAG: MFS transporter, partial [Caulobacteraceae bacterium]
MADLAAAGKRLPPIPLMGAGFIPVGVSGLIMLFVIPELMAARHIAEPVIAAVTALGLLPGFLSFLLAPLLDWRFSRRVWALLFTSLTVAASFVALMVVGDPGLLAAALFVSGLASALSAAAVGGWFGSIVPERDKARLGAWFTVGNFGAGGIVAAVGLPLLHAISYPVGAAVLALGNLLVVPLLFWTPCPAADGRLASESVAAFAREMARAKIAGVLGIRSRTRVKA